MHCSTHCLLHFFVSFVVILTSLHPFLVTFLSKVTGAIGTYDSVLGVEIAAVEMQWVTKGTL